MAECRELYKKNKKIKRGSTSGSYSFGSCKALVNHTTVLRLVVFGLLFMLFHFGVNRSTQASTLNLLSFIVNVCDYKW